jgi:hypothetical protein
MLANGGRLYTGSGIRVTYGADHLAGLVDYCYCFCDIHFDFVWAASVVIENMCSAKTCSVLSELR